MTITQKIGFNLTIFYALEGEENKEEKWIQYSPDNEPFYSPAMPSDFTLRPDENKISVCHLDYAQSGKHVFAQPGKYKIKGYIDLLESKPVEIVVKSLTEEADIKANELVKNDIGKFLHPWTILKYKYDGETVKSLEKFIVSSGDTIPNSK